MKPMFPNGFDPTIQCEEVHPLSGERCQVFGATVHNGNHWTMVQETPTTVLVKHWQTNMPQPVTLNIKQVVSLTLFSTFRMLGKQIRGVLR